jgi:hypothetical protein
VTAGTLDDLRERMKIIQAAAVGQFDGQAMETSDGHVVRLLSFESWLDEFLILVGSSSHGFTTPTKKPYVPTIVGLSCLSLFLTSLHIE